MRRSVKVKSKFKFLKVLASIVVIIALVLCALQLGVELKHKNAIWTPDYEMSDLTDVLSKPILSEEDYQELFVQTGLTRAGVDDLISSNKKDRIFEIQKSFFEKRKLEINQFISFTCCDRTDAIAQTIELSDGDILVTPSTHFSFVDIGHAALVVDAENDIMLNATGYDVDSITESVEEITCRPAFVVLRPKLSEKKRCEAAKYAVKELCDIPYSLSVGILSSKFSDKTDRTNCGHVVWRAYKQVGIDIDSNGGALVLPFDILKSDQLEVMQIHGIDPTKI